MALYVKGDQQVETTHPAEGVRLQRSGFRKVEPRKKQAPKPANKAVEPPANKAPDTAESE